MDSHCFKLGRSNFISFNLSNVGEIFLVESERTVCKFRKRKRKFLCCAHLLHTKGGRVKLGSFMSQLCSGWEMYKKDWSTCKVFFCQSKPIVFFAVYRRSCKNSLLLWSRNFATMVTWHHTSPLYSPACGNSHSITTKFLPKPNHPYPSQKTNRLLAHRQKRNGTSGILTWGKSRASLPIPFFTSLL